MIQSKIIYQFDKKEFNNLKQIETEIENKLGKYLDKACNDGIFNARHRLQIFDYIINNQSELCNILNDFSDLRIEIESEKEDD
jgi:hypothetical protein